MTAAETLDAVDRGRRRLETLAAWSNCLPQRLWPGLARVGASSHPFALTAAEYATGCATGLAIVPGAATGLARRHLRRHVLGYFRSRRYARIAGDWWRRAVRIEDAQEVLPQLLREGGLVLTSHVPEYHLLAVMLGQARQAQGTAGGVFPVVMAEHLSPFHAVIGDYLSRLHEDTARHFNAGGYVFIEPGASRKNDVAKLLETSAIVVALNDNYNPQSAVQSKFFGRAFGVRGGSVRIALEARRPIYYAWWQAGMPDAAYRLRLIRLYGETPEALLGEYLHQLATDVRAAPDVWDGWAWLRHAPDAL